jgi:hypothetical protein
VLYDCETWAMAQQKKNDSKIWEWKNVQKDMYMAQWKIKIAVESELMMNYRLCIENQIL